MRAADLFEDIEKTVSGLGASFTAECLGGGRCVVCAMARARSQLCFCRIKRDTSKKTLIFYGYSVGFGQAEHAKAVEIATRVLPDYTITFSNEGY